MTSAVLRLLDELEQYRPLHAKALRRAIAEDRAEAWKEGRDAAADRASKMPQRADPETYADEIRALPVPGATKPPEPPRWYRCKVCREALREEHTTFNKGDRVHLRPTECGLAPCGGVESIPAMREGR